MTSERQPRMGELDGLSIEILPSAVSTYAQTRRNTDGYVRTPEEARADVERIIRASYVTREDGDYVQLRSRDRERGLDVQSEARFGRGNWLVVSLVSVRGLRRGAGAHGSGKEPGVYRIRAANGEALGFLRPGEDGIEFRRPRTETWGPPPRNLRAVADELASRGVDTMHRWLDREGYTR